MNISDRASARRDRMRLRFEACLDASQQHHGHDGRKRHGTEATGSTARVDEESGDVEVTGHSERVCTEWDFQIKRKKD
jgi:hypothetical protein